MKIELEEHERTFLAYGIGITGEFWYEDERIRICLVKKEMWDALWKISQENKRRVK